MGKKADHFHVIDVFEETFLLNQHTSRFYKIDHITKEMIELISKDLEEKDMIYTLSKKYPIEKISRNLKILHTIGLFDKKSTGPKAPTESENRPIDTLDLQISHQCNLSCKYCYAQGGNFGQKNQLMTVESARRAVDFLFRNSNGNKNLSISFDGGEPLLNLKLIKEMTIYSRKKAQESNKKITFSVGTNGTLITDEVAGFFSEFQFAPQISVDGTPRYHDQLRPFSNGLGSHEKITLGAEKLKQKGVKFPSRITITPRNLNLNDTVEHLHHLGFFRIAAFPATAIPGEYALTFSELEILKEEYNKTADYFLDSLFNKGEYVGFANFTDNIRDFYFAKQKQFSCGAARKFFSIAPNEDIYPCHRFVGNQKYKLGNLKNGLLADKRLPFLENHVDIKESCQDCWAKYLCGGGCLVEADFYNSNLKTPFHVSCEIIKYEKKLSMMIYSKIHSRDASILEKIAKNQMPGTREDS